MLSGLTHFPRDGSQLYRPYIVVISVPTVIDEYHGCWIIKVKVDETSTMEGAKNFLDYGPNACYTMSRHRREEPNMLSLIGEAVYHLLEQLDGERGEHTHVITYRTAQSIKVFILVYMIK